ncbi:hamartin isoform X2 [Phlebotomus argentipes]|nr:hamartin isoform X2 [Phlebotomus argentipes]
MVDYFCQTSSIRIVEILVKVQSPHDKFIFDRIAEHLRASDKVSALTLLSLIIPRHPTWLFRVTAHPLWKDLLKLLKTEMDIVPVFSALLCVITLLPMIPYQMKESLPDLFDVFSHLASWSSQNQSRPPEDHLVHLQFGFYDFFHRLYGMFPCNFISFLQHEYSGNKEKSAIFTHTIKPLLETVKMHPMLVTENRETETNTKRWRTMEPHDVVVECANLTLDSLGKGQSECSHNLPPRPIEAGDLILPAEHKITGIVRGNQYESVWTPSQVVLATPPSSATSVPHTPTPGHFSSVPMATPTLPSSQQILSVGGASPPEAAVEATPETTPLKDNMKTFCPLPTNSSVVRAMYGATGSQPSSPMKKDVSPFRFPEPSLKASKFERLVQDHADVARTASIESPHASIPGSPLLNPSVDNLKSPPVSYEGDIPSNDQTIDVNQTLDNKENYSQSNDATFPLDCEDYDAAEGSPCSAGGLHIPNSRSMLDFARKFNRWRMHSHCLGDTSQCFSAGTSPADVAVGGIGAGARVMKRSRSWPDVRRAEAAAVKPPQQNGEDLSVATKEAASHYRQQPIARKPLRELGRMEIVERMDRDTQTIEQWPLAYEHLFINLLSETNKIKQTQENNAADSIVQSPYAMLDRYIELSISRKHAMDAKDQVAAYREQIQLLTLQLQYERHRREVHAERNRRLLGRNRSNLALELQNETLRRQIAQLANDYTLLQATFKSSRQDFNKREQDLMKDCNTWKLKYNKEVEENKQLRQRIESLENRVVEETRQRQEADSMVGSVRGELMDLKNEMQQVEYHADLGSQYRDECMQMQKEILMMGEIQAKCRDKLSELSSLRNRDKEIEDMKNTFEVQCAELKTAYEQKSSQLERTKARLAELEANLTGRDEIMTEQKKLLKTVKEEFEERFEAQEQKYNALKAVIARMEEQMLELYKSPANSGMIAQSPESDKTDMVGSLDHASPLSISLASSDGVSASLRSMAEIRDLQSLVNPSSSAINNQPDEGNPTTSSSTSWHPSK